MAAPNVQLAVNAGKMQVFWDVDLGGAYALWKLYWDDEPGYVDWNVVATNIPNVADSYYSKPHVTYNFARPLAETLPIYLWLTGIFPGGVEDVANPSLQRYAPAMNEIEPMLKQKPYGYDPDTGIWRPIKVEKDTDPSIAGVLDVSP